MTVRISLTTIVKNEAATLGRCLASVRDLADEIIVVDTGSFDNTRDIARHHGARVFDFPWRDSFAAARNESLRHANGQWLLWLDADESFDEANRSKLRQLLSGLSDGNAAYVMRQRSAAANGSATLVGQKRIGGQRRLVEGKYSKSERSTATAQDRHQGKITASVDKRPCCRLRTVAADVSAGAMVNIRSAHTVSGPARGRNRRRGWPGW